MNPFQNPIARVTNNLLLTIDLAYFGSFSTCMLLGFQEQCVILVVHNGSPYLPIVDRIDLVLMYIQSVSDSAQAFINFIGLILIPYLSSKVQEKKSRNKRIYSQSM